MLSTFDYQHRCLDRILTPGKRKCEVCGIFVVLPQTMQGPKCHHGSSTGGSPSECYKIGIRGDWQKLVTVVIRALDDGGCEFPINFDYAWRFVGYSNKANDLGLNNGGFKEGLDPAITINMDFNFHANDQIPAVKRTSTTT